MQSIYKVPNGKLLKIFWEVEEGKISELKITGDFFLHPEESIVELEQALVGQPLEEEQLTARLEGVIREKNIELFGVDVESIITVLLSQP